MRLLIVKSKFDPKPMCGDPGQADYCTCGCDAYGERCAHWLYRDLLNLEVDKSHICCKTGK